MAIYTVFASQGCYGLAWARRRSSISFRRGIRRERIRPARTPRMQYERVAMMEVFYMPLLKVACETDIVMRREQQASSFLLSQWRTGASKARWTRSEYSQLAQGRPPPPPFAHVAPMIGLPVEARLGSETRLELTHRHSHTSGLIPDALGLVARPAN